MAEKHENWWEDEDTEIGQSENHDWGLQNIHARQRADGTWEYACVGWSFHTSWLKWILRDGQFIRDEDQE